MIFLSDFAAAARLAGRAALATLALVLLSFPAGCDFRGTGEQYRSPAAIAFEERGLSLKEAIHSLIAESERLSEAEETIVLTSEGPVRIIRRTPAGTGRPGPAAPPPSTWKPGGPEIEPLGERLYESEGPIRALAVANDGSLFLAGERLLRVRSGTGPEAVADIRAAELRLDATGSRLAAAGEGRALLLEGEGLATVRDLGDVPTGPMAWSLDGGSLIFTRDHMLLDAEEEERIFLEAVELDLATGELTEDGFGRFRRYAAIGTLPPASLMWAHLRQAEQIDPLPAPLLRVEEGAPFGFLTETMDAADTQPVASANGDLAWIRTRRQGAATARAHLGHLGNGGQPTLVLSRAATHHVAISPSGEWGALVIEEEPGKLSVRRFTLQDARERSNDLARLAEADRRFVQQLAALGSRLREAYGRLPEVTRAHSEDSPEFAGGISPGSLQTMREALAAGLQRQHGLSLSRSVGSLADLDAFLDHARPHLPPEDPAWIAALGAHTGFVLEHEANAVWTLERWQGGLSEGIWPDFGTNGVTWAIACPFATARSALYGEVALRDAPERIASASDGLPLYLTDNLGEQAVDVVELTEFARAGFPEEAIRLGELRDLIWANDGLTPAAALFASSAGEEYGAAEMRVLGALRLAEMSPTRPEALRLLAKGLVDSYETTLAREVYGLLVEYLHDDAEARLEYGDVLATLDLLSEASHQYRVAGHFDESGMFGSDLHDRLEMLRRIEAGE